LAIFVQDFKS